MKRSVGPGALARSGGAKLRVWNTFNTCHLSAVLRMLYSDTQITRYPDNQFLVYQRQG